MLRNLRLGYRCLNSKMSEFCFYIGSWLVTKRRFDTTTWLEILSEHEKGKAAPGPSRHHIRSNRPFSCVWWSTRAFLYHEGSKPSESITAVFHPSQLRKPHSVFCQKQPGLTKTNEIRRNVGMPSHTLQRWRRTPSKMWIGKFGFTSFTRPSTFKLLFIPTSRTFPQ